MIFGKHINKYYLKYLGWIIMGVLTLGMVDYLQLLIPNIYASVINGINQGFVEVDGAAVPFDMDFLLDHVCLPMIKIILTIEHYHSSDIFT